MLAPSGERQANVHNLRPTSGLNVHAIKRRGHGFNRRCDKQQVTRCPNSATDCSQAVAHVRDQGLTYNIDIEVYLWQLRYQQSRRFVLVCGTFWDAVGSVANIDGLNSAKYVHIRSIVD